MSLKQKRELCLQDSSGGKDHTMPVNQSSKNSFRIVVWELWTRMHKIEDNIKS